MARATADDQLKFLLSCVKHSNNGKVDFVEVAREIGIVSKGAAAKRYERLMKANGINPNASPSDRTTSLFPAKERSKAAIAKAAMTKKRKIEGDRPDAFRRDEEETRSRYNKAEGLDTPQFIKNELPTYGFRPFMFSSMPTPPPPFFPSPGQMQTMNGASMFDPPAPFTSNHGVLYDAVYNPMRQSFPSASTNSMLSNQALCTPVQTQSLLTKPIDDKSSIPLIDDFWNQDSKDNHISHVLDAGLQPLDQPGTLPTPLQGVVLSVSEPANATEIKQESTRDTEAVIVPENCILIAD